MLVVLSGSYQRLMDDLLGRLRLETEGMSVKIYRYLNISGIYIVLGN